MLAFIKSGFTANNGDLDDARLAAFLLVVSFIGNSAYAIYQGQHWDALQFGGGAGALAAGIGIWFKQRGGN